MDWTRSIHRPNRHSDERFGGSGDDRNLPTSELLAAKCPIREKFRVIRENMRVVRLGQIPRRCESGDPPANATLARLGPACATATRALGRDKAHGSARDVLHNRLTDMTETSVVRQWRPVFVTVTYWPWISLCGTRYSAYSQTAIDE
jgi:hypothetical protein